jgi:hypothetical protein
MKESNATRVFWTVRELTRHQWASQNVNFSPVATVQPSKTKPKSAIKPPNNSDTWAKVATLEGGVQPAKKKSVRVDDAALKAKLRQVKISGSKNRYSTFFSITLSLPKTSDPPMKFIKIAQDLANELMTVNDTVVIHPYMAKISLRRNLSRIRMNFRRHLACGTPTLNACSRSRRRVLRYIRECWWATMFLPRI